MRSPSRSRNKSISSELSDESPIAKERAVCTDRRLFSALPDIRCESAPNKIGTSYEALLSAHAACSQLEKFADSGAAVPIIVQSLMYTEYAERENREKLFAIVR